MFEGKIKNIINSYINDVVENFDVERVFLFGSFSRDNDNNNSDVDLAFFIKNIKDKERMDVMTKLLLLSYKFKIDIQPLVFSVKDLEKKENSFIQKEIIKKGIELFYRK